MIKGFKDFIMRGNVVDLAIAVVIGTAFTRVVESFVSAIITPLLNSLPGSSVNGWGFALRHGAKFTDKNGKNTTYIDFSTIVNAIIVFLLTALVVYLVFVVPMTRLQRFRDRGRLPGPEVVPENTQLLREIRDALGARPVTGAGGPTEARPGTPRAAQP